jgi:hypothetical protein
MLLLLPAFKVAIRPTIARAAVEEDDEERQYDENGVMVGLGTAQLRLQTIQLEDGAYYEVPGVWKVGSIQRINLLSYC